MTKNSKILTGIIAGTLAVAGGTGGAAVVSVTVKVGSVFRYRLAQ